MYCGLRGKLQKHLNDHHVNENTRKCNYCCDVYHCAYSWKIHLAECAKRPLLQEFCVSLTNQSKWKNIECVVNLYTAIPFGFNQSYYCFYCLNIYDDFQALYRHTRLIHPIFNSEIASLMSDELKNSVKVNVANLACKLCGSNSIFIDLGNFVNHIIDVHYANYDKTIDISKCFKTFYIFKGNIRCSEPDCRKFFYLIKSLLLHNDAEHKYECNHCGRGLRTQILLQAHFINQHAAPKTAVTVSSSY